MDLCELQGLQQKDRESLKLKIFGAAAIVALFTLVSKAASVGKEVAVAFWFGTGDSLDAFLMGFLVPSFVINVVAGSFTSAFIPTFIKVRMDDGPGGAQELFSCVMAWSILLLCGVAVLLGVSAPYYLPVLCSGFSPEKVRMTLVILLILLPVTILKGVSTILSGVLNALERFAFAAAVPVFVPVFAVVFLVLGGKVWGIFALAFGTVIGFGMETISLGLGLRRVGIKLMPRFSSFGSDMRIVIGQYIPMVAGAMIMGSTELVDQSMAAALAPGSVASLSYGNKIIGLMLGLAATALGTAVLPYFSKMVAERNWRNLRKILKFYLVMIFTFAVPAALIILWLSEPLIQLVFQRGSFSLGDTEVVSSIQAMFSFQIPFYIAGILLVRLISSLRANYILMWGAIISLTVNVGLNIIFIYLIGLKGIALSTSMVYTLSFAFLLFFSTKIIRKKMVADST